MINSKLLYPQHPDNDRHKSSPVFLGYLNHSDIRMLSDCLSKIRIGFFLQNPENPDISSIQKRHDFVRIPLCIPLHVSDFINDYKFCVFIEIEEPATDFVKYFRMPLRNMAIGTDTRKNSRLIAPATCRNKIDVPVILLIEDRYAPESRILQPYGEQNGGNKRGCAK